MRSFLVAAALVLFASLGGCGGLGPECKRMIDEVEKVCKAKDAAPGLCGPDMTKAIEEAKKSKSSPEEEKQCKSAADAFAEMSKMMKDMPGGDKGPAAPGTGAPGGAPGTGAPGGDAGGAAPGGDAGGAAPGAGGPDSAPGGQ